jgi:hypothetical protein
MVCHGGESPSLRPFDVKEAMQRIDHWTADRAARKAGPPRAGALRPGRSRLALWLKAAP